MDLGRVGVWTFHLDQFPWTQGPEFVQELETLGYGSIWLPEAVNRDPFVSATLVLGATQRLRVATGIASIYARGPMAMNAGWQTISEAFPGRFVLGMGVSHAPAVEGFHRTTYGPPLAAMRAYLDAMDTALFFAPRSPEPPRRVLAALGPKMLALAAARTDGAHPYLVTPEHTKTARDALGPDKLLAVEQKVALTPGDAAEGRRRGARSWARTWVCRTTRTTGSGSVSPPTTILPTAAATGWSTRRSRGETRTRSDRACRSTSTPAPTTSASR